jgi:uncharacterized membrane protein YeaQ/YmgE (transglycosylase-associated protein family)
MYGLRAFAQVAHFGIGIVGWIVAGLLAGWLVHRFAHGISETRVAATVFGLVGALIGGVMFGVLMMGTAGLWGSLAVAFASGLVFTWVVVAATERSAR